MSPAVRFPLDVVSNLLAVVRGLAGDDDAGSEIRVFAEVSSWMNQRAIRKSFDITNSLFLKV